MAQWWSFSALQFEKMFEQGHDLECMDTNALCVFVSLQRCLRRFALFLFKVMKASQWKSSILSWLLFFRTVSTFSLGMKQSQRSTHRQQQPTFPNLCWWLRTVNTELFPGLTAWLAGLPESVWDQLYLVRLRLILHGSSSMYFLSSKMRLMMGFSTSCKYNMPTAWKRGKEKCSNASFLHGLWLTQIQIGWQNGITNM